MKRKQRQKRYKPKSKWQGGSAVRHWEPHHRSQDRLFQNTGVYVMTNFPVFWLNKFGISDKVRNRERNVSETTPGLVFAIFSLKLAYGFQIEQFVHGLYSFQNVRFWTGSGRTEWFIVFSPIVGFATFYLNSHFSLGLSPFTITLAFFTPFVWWDGIFWLLFFGVLKFIIAAAVLLVACFAIAHIK